MRVKKKYKKLSPEQVEKYWNLYKSGSSLKQIEKYSGIYGMQLSRLFKKYYPEEYKKLAKVKSSNDLVNIIKNEYLKSNLLTPEQKDEIREWLTKEKIYEIMINDSKYEVKLLTEKGEKAFCNCKNIEQIYTGRVDKDFRDIIDSVDLEKYEWIPRMKKVKPMEGKNYDNF